LVSLFDDDVNLMIKFINLVVVAWVVSVANRPHRRVNGRYVFDGKRIGLFHLVLVEEAGFPLEAVPTRAYHTGFYSPKLVNRDSLDRHPKE